MKRNCEQCGAKYDDTYRTTICPHPEFAMRTVVMQADGRVDIATSLEQLYELMPEKFPQRRDAS